MRIYKGIFFGSCTFLHFFHFLVLHFLRGQVAFSPPPLCLIHLCCASGIFSIIPTPRPCREHTLDIPPVDDVFVLSTTRGRYQGIFLTGLNNKGFHPKYPSGKSRDAKSGEEPPRAMGPAFPMRSLQEMVRRFQESKVSKAVRKFLPPPPPLSLTPPCR